MAILISAVAFLLAGLAISLLLPWHWHQTNVIARYPEVMACPHIEITSKGFWRNVGRLPWRLYADKGYRPTGPSSASGFVDYAFVWCVGNTLGASSAADVAGKCASGLESKGWAIGGKWGRDNEGALWGFLAEHLAHSERIRATLKEMDWAEVITCDAPGSDPMEGLSVYIIACEESSDARIVILGHRWNHSLR